MFSSVLPLQEENEEQNQTQTPPNLGQLGSLVSPSDEGLLNMIGGSVARKGASYASAALGGWAGDLIALPFDIFHNIERNKMAKRLKSFGFKPEDKFFRDKMASFDKRSLLRNLIPDTKNMRTIIDTLTGGFTEAKGEPDFFDRMFEIAGSFAGGAGIAAKIPAAFRKFKQTGVTETAKGIGAGAWEGLKKMAKPFRITKPSEKAQKELIPFAHKIGKMFTLGAVGAGTEKMLDAADVQSPLARIPVQLGAMALTSLILPQKIARKGIGNQIEGWENRLPAKERINPEVLEVPGDEQVEKIFGELGKNQHPEIQKALGSVSGKAKEYRKIKAARAEGEKQLKKWTTEQDLNNLELTALEDEQAANAALFRNRADESQKAAINQIADNQIKLKINKKKQGELTFEEFSTKDQIKQTREKAEESGKKLRTTHTQKAIEAQVEEVGEQTRKNLQEKRAKTKREAENLATEERHIGEEIIERRPKGVSLKKAQQRLKRKGERQGDVEEQLEKKLSPKEIEEEVNKAKNKERKKLNKEREKYQEDVEGAAKKIAKTKAKKGGETKGDKLELEERTLTRAINKAEEKLKESIENPGQKLDIRIRRKRNTINNKADEIRELSERLETGDLSEAALKGQEVSYKDLTKWVRNSKSLTADVNASNISKPSKKMLKKFIQGFTEKADNVLKEHLKKLDLAEPGKNYLKTYEQLMEAYFVNEHMPKLEKKVRDLLGKHGKYLGWGAVFNIGKALPFVGKAAAAYPFYAAFQGIQALRRFGSSPVIRKLTLNFLKDTKSNHLAAALKSASRLSKAVEKEDAKRGRYQILGQMKLGKRKAA